MKQIFTNTFKNHSPFLVSGLFVVFMVFGLSGCAALIGLKTIWPKNHDPALVSNYVQLSISLEKVDCNKKETFNQAIIDADWLNRYAEFRNDSQKVSTKAIHDNLKKASESGEVACKRWVNLSNISMKTIKDSWGGR